MAGDVRRLVVVGERRRFDLWLRQQLPEVRQMVKPVSRWSDMLGYQNVVVQFMPDWAEHRTSDECDRIIEQAQMIEDRREAMKTPFKVPE